MKVLIILMTLSVCAVCMNFNDKKQYMFTKIGKVFPTNSYVHYGMEFGIKPLRRYFGVAQNMTDTIKYLSDEHPSDKELAFLHQTAARRMKGIGERYENVKKWYQGTRKRISRSYFEEAKVTSSTTPSTTPISGNDIAVDRQKRSLLGLGIGAVGLITGSIFSLWNMGRIATLENAFNRQEQRRVAMLHVQEKLTIQSEANTHAISQMEGILNEFAGAIGKQSIDVNAIIYAHRVEYVLDMCEQQLELYQHIIDKAIDHKFPRGLVAFEEVESAIAHMQILASEDGYELSITQPQLLDMCETSVIFDGDTNG